MDLEGRIITLEFDHFFVTQVYTPNAGDGLKRLAERQVWDVKYAEYLAELDKEKPVLATGDYNVAHMEIDLANPASNRRSPGFTDEEREGFTNLLAKGFTDTFRHLHGDVPERYTWWAQRSKTSKINNTGWRIDYWLTSNRIADKVTKSDMIDSGARQDHTPIGVNISFGIKDVPRLYQKLLESNYPIHRPLTKREFRVGEQYIYPHEFSVLDPDGYFLRFSE